MSRKWMLTVLAAAVVLISDRSVASATPPLKSDFNGDGYEDLAIGAPYEDLPSAADAGMVHVVYGSWSGVTTSGSQVFRQGFGGLPGQAQASDRFGNSLAAGDFNGDGYSDLAIGVPGEGVGSLNSAGAVVILDGSGDGLTTAGSDFWHQDVFCFNNGAILGQAGAGDEFGWRLAAGYFNSDGYADLAVGVQFETVDAGNVSQAGAVNVIYGSSFGLTCSGNQLWYQGNLAWSSPSETGDRFGYALAVGYFNGDAYHDLVVGVPFEDVPYPDVGWAVEAGEVDVLLGSSAGLTAPTYQSWWRDRAGIQGVSTPGDYFGYALAAGNFNGDNFDDLAIGIPGANDAGSDNAGAVTILLGSQAALTDSGNQLWHQGFLAGSVDTGDSFGWSLAAGDFGNGWYDDLAVGVAFDEVNGLSVGSVNVIYGSGGGLGTVGNSLLNQGSPGISDSPESFDLFGGRIAARDFNGDGFADLAVGAYQEDLVNNTIKDAGVVHVLYAANTGSGISGSNSLLLDQGMIGGQIEGGDMFGYALCTR